MNQNIFESIKNFAETYAAATDTFFCKDISITKSVLIGLTINKEKYGSPLCPCRYYDNKEDEISLSYWNCPCIPMRERRECHCMLFLPSGNAFSSELQKLI